MLFDQLLQLRFKVRGLMNIEEELEKLAEKRVECLVARSKREEVRPASG